MIQYTFTEENIQEIEGKRYYKGKESIKTKVILKQKEAKFWIQFHVEVMDEEGEIILKDYPLESLGAHLRYPAYRKRRRFCKRIEIQKIYHRLFQCKEKKEKLNSGKKRAHNVYSDTYYLKIDMDTKVEIGEVEVLDLKGKKIEFELVEPRKLC